MKKIPLSSLAGACEEQLAVARAEWPEGIPLTPAAARRAVKLGLDLDWAAKKLLPAAAYEAYEEATAPALKAYEEATAPALKAYEEATAAAYEAYREATAAAYEAYREATAAAYEAYREAKAAVLLKLLRAQ